MNVAQTRPLRPDDLPAAHALTSGLGWPHRLEDWQFMLSHGAGIAAERDGMLIGTGMSWHFGADAASVGMMAVAPTAQGHGLGRRILELVLAALGTRRVLLHATEAGLKLYRSLGFVEQEIVRQHQGLAIAGDAVAAERLRPATPPDASKLMGLDRAATGVDRSVLLAALLREADCVVLERGGNAVGFALLRRFGRGALIGPVIAPDADAARALIDHFLAPRTGEFLRVDVPETAELGSWLATRGLADAGPAVRMLRGPLHQSGAFALISQALG